MAPTIILPQFVPKEAVKLGRFSTTIEPPYPDFRDPDCTKSPRELISHHESYTGVHQTEATSTLGVALTSLLSAGFSKRAKTNVRIVTNLFKTYYLEEFEGWFEEATTIPAMRQWAERKYQRGHDIYMVVGFHTVTDARIIEDSIAGKAAGGQIKLPVSLSLAAAGVIAPLGDLTDPSMGRDHHSVGLAQLQFIARGEQICAVQYRKVGHKWLSSKDLDKARLSKALRWFCMERSRDEVEGEDDLIEVELTEVQALDGQWAQKVVGDKVFFVQSSVEV